MGEERGEERRWTGRIGLSVSSSITYRFDELELDVHIADTGCGIITYDSQVVVSVAALDHVCDPLTAFHPQLDKLSEHLEDSLARARSLLLEDGWGDAAKLELKVVFFPVPPPLKARGLCFRTKFNRRVVRVIRETSGG